MYLVASAWQSKIMASVSRPFIVPRTMLWPASNSSKIANVFAPCSHASVAHGDLRKLSQTEHIPPARFASLAGLFFPSCHHLPLHNPTPSLASNFPTSRPARLVT